MNLLEEARELAESRSASYQQNLHRYHASWIHPRSFREGDLVLQLIQDTKGRHKLSFPWEGPFIVSWALLNNAYYLTDAREPKKDQADTSFAETECPWNAYLLRRFHA